MNTKDYYSILGLQRTATDDDIKKAYRKLASKYHPDKVTDESEKKVVEEQFKEIAEAYGILSDADKRSQYDNPGHFGSQHSGTRHWSFNQSNPEDLNSMFSDIFSQFNRHQQARQTIQVLEISLEDAFKGRTIRVDQSTNITVPPGVRSGTKFFHNNKLYRVDVRPHVKFKRTNDDLLVDIHITAIEAILGIDATLEHLDGSKLQFSIPAGIQVGQIVKLTGKGTKNPENNRSGDLLVRVSIVMPTNLSDEDKNKIKSLSHRDTINI